MRQSTLTVRLLRAVALAAIIAGSGADPVVAKIPYFTVDIKPTAPVAGEPIRVVVRFWADADHTSAAPFDWETTMDDLLVFRPERGGPGVAVPLQMREPGRFEATVTLEAGDWTLVAFPDRTGWATAQIPEGYPDTIPLTVREAALDAWRSVGPFVLVALAIGAEACAWFLLLRGLSQLAGRDIRVTQ
jgi:hypothetical protein